MTPQDAAAARLAAIAELQAQLARAITAAQRRLYQALLLRLEDIYDRPELLPMLLREFSQLVQVPLLTTYARSILTLPGLTSDYFRSIEGVTNYTRLRAPLTSWLTRTFGIDASGTPTATGYLSTYLNDTGTARALLHYAYTAQATGAGLSEYRDGLTDLVLGASDARTKGLYEKLYDRAADTFNQADRQLQGLAADELGLDAALYQGGLIAGSRAFCKVRNGRVFLRSEIEKFGTPDDSYGGYTDKSKGLFSGKSEPYHPLTDLGGYGCRHGLHFIPNTVAISLRPELREDAQGRLVVA